MAYKLTIPFGSTTGTLFLQAGFYTPGLPSHNLHKHSYPEIHAILGGQVHFLIGQTHYNLQGGNIFLVPADVPHCCLSCSDSVIHTAFQIDIPPREFHLYAVSPHLLDAFFAEIRNCTLDHSRLIPWFSLLFCDLFPTTPVYPPAITDPAFLIGEFFSRRYQEDVTLVELAETLHFSPKHTARLVQKHMGQTFHQALTAQRMAIAAYLAETTDMPLTQIAQYVGYQTYSGFWKAFKKSGYMQKPVVFPKEI